MEPAPDDRWEGKLRNKPLIFRQIFPVFREWERREGVKFGGGGSRKRKLIEPKTR